MNNAHSLVDQDFSLYEAAKKRQIMADKLLYDGFHIENGSYAHIGESYYQNVSMVVLCQLYMKAMERLDLHIRRTKGCSTKQILSTLFEAELFIIPQRGCPDRTHSKYHSMRS